MSDAKNSCITCEKVALYPVRIALANRIGKDGPCRPDYWPAGFPGTAKTPEIPHWGYACRLLRPGWVYVYYSQTLYTYQCTPRGFKSENGFKLQGEALESVPVDGAFRHAIYVPKDTQGWIAYSENAWSIERIKQILGNGKRRIIRMQQFTTKQPTKNMLPFSKENWDVVEEMREIPNGLVCMGVELGTDPNSRYNQLCYHGLRNFSLLRIPWSHLWQWNEFRRAKIREHKIAPEIEKQYCIPLENKAALPEKFPHHISWHAVEAVSPFTWLWNKKDDDAYERSELGKLLAALTCGYIIALDDPVGICRELSALCEHGHDDEALFRESIAYPATIALYLDSLSATGQSSANKFTRLSVKEVFKKSAFTAFEHISAYIEEITKARKVWMFSTEGCKKLLWECFEDIIQDTEERCCARELMLAGVVSGFAHHDKGLELADLLFKEEQENLLWSTLSPSTGLSFPETAGTEQIIASLWRYFLPTDASHTENTKNLLQSLTDRKIFAGKTYSDAEMLFLGQALEGRNTDDTPDPNRNYGTLVYTSGSAETPSLKTLHTSIPEPASLDPQYTSFIPKALETHWGLQDLGEAEVVAKYRLKVTLLAAYNIWLICEKKDPSSLEVVGLSLTFGVGLTGLAEWGAQYRRWGKTQLRMGVANKALGGFLSLVVIMSTGLDAAKAFEEGRFGQGLLLAGTSVASGLLGYTSVAKALESIATAKKKMAQRRLRAWAKLALRRLPWGKTVAGMALSPYILGAFIAADIYDLHAAITNPINRWAMNCVFGTKNEHISLKRLCALAPLYQPLSLPGDPAEKLEEEHRRLYKALYTPFIRMFGRPPATEPHNNDGAPLTEFQKQFPVTVHVRLPGVGKGGSRLWLWWHIPDPYRGGERRKKEVSMAGCIKQVAEDGSVSLVILLKRPADLPFGDAEPLHYAYEVLNPALGTTRLKGDIITGPVEVDYGT